jgi:ABC-type sugar transport system ATPase subunit
MLSGGNQQKALFARALESTPRALLMIDPTAGVDIGARAELYDLLRRETARGMAVILASSDFEEIESLADRALVLANGSPVALLEGAALTQSRLVYEALRPVEAQSACAQAGDKEMSR